MVKHGQFRQHEALNSKGLRRPRCRSFESGAASARSPEFKGIETLEVLAGRAGFQSARSPEFKGIETI